MIRKGAVMALGIGAGAGLARWSGVDAAHASAAAPAPDVLLASHQPRPATPAPAPVQVALPRPEPEWAEGAIITGATEHRIIHFTFDDGPDRRTTPQLLDTLDALGIKATFFVTTQRMASLGGRARSERRILAEIAQRGHRIGNHTVNHEQLPLLTPLEAREEVEAASNLIEEVTGQRPTLIRPPGGSRSPRVDAMLAEMGLTQVLWNIGSGDFQVRDADEVTHIFRRVLARREREAGERGGVVLMHDTHPWSIAALPRIVDHLRQRNCELLEEGEELYDIVDDISLFYSPREGDPGALAAPAVMPEARHQERQAALRTETALRCSAVAQSD